ncbi:MAG: ion transporter [Vicinamibacterales bacterium]|jgi:voltage-gated potassium channel|nr:ion transporter [Acidobacteriota bacterium]MDP6371307.1 ion transporter [Vicinamibacterales bacterium]MDP6609044.1 ion transporter [Vicinamibacterales bacterium]HAK55066.1 ion transporter [Acidobacteriota bacterium]|tara:strand:- start:7353 stop:8201 length:849 start_codon:yes stop_codon:yes gene_type:complete
MTPDPRDTPMTPWRRDLHQIVFEADTPAGKLFDLVLIASILISVAAVMLDSVATIHARYGAPLLWVEWGFTLLFTIEYAVRLLSVRQPGRYATSFFGVVDLLAILPTYLSLVMVGTQSLLVIRALRLLRIFRVFKLGHYLKEAEVLATALRASRVKITVFMATVLSIALIAGALLYLIEGETNGFTSIPRAMYWAVVTMTTVGYGDIAPRTVLGQIAASGLMILGYAIIAVPTGIVSAELVRQTARRPVSTQACLACSCEGHDHDATHCKYCGAGLYPDGAR